MKKLRFWPLVLVALLAGSARADVEVRFIDPKGFSDLRDDFGFNRLEVLKDIEAHLIAEAGKRLRGQDLLLEVTDVDLAGEMEPWGRRSQWLRVLRTVTAPSMELRFELREGGKVVRSGTARLRDLGYMDGGGMYSGSEPLRYERRMIDRWLDREFGPKAGTVKP